MTATTEKVRLFVDIDGTLAAWRAVDEFEELLAPGFYRDMHPNTNVVRALEILKESHGDELEIFTLGAIPREAKLARNEKDKWLDAHVSAVDSEHRIYCFCDERKCDVIPGSIRPSDVLLDDYTKNLMEWAKKAKALKLLNGVNNSKGTWQGEKVGKYTDHRILAEQIYQFAMSA